MNKSNPSHIKKILLNNQKVFNISSKKIKIEKLGEGLRNINYKCIAFDKIIVARISISKESELSKEYTFLKQIENYGISPKPYLYQQTKNFEILFLEYIKGKHPVRMTKKRIVKLAEITAALHNIKIKNKHLCNKQSHFQNVNQQINNFLDKLKNKLNTQEKSIVNQVIGILKEKDLPKIFSIVHGDIHKKNLIINSKSMFFIDFDSAKIGDPAFELVEIQNSFNFSKRQFQIFLEEYNKYLYDVSLNERIEMYKPQKALIWYLWALDGIYFENERQDFYYDEKNQALKLLHEYNLIKKSL